MILYCTRSRVPGNWTRYDIYVPGTVCSMGNTCQIADPMMNFAAIFSLLLYDIIIDRACIHRVPRLPIVGESPQHLENVLGTLLGILRGTILVEQEATATPSARTQNLFFIPGILHLRPISVKIARHPVHVVATLFTRVLGLGIPVPQAEYIKLRVTKHGILLGGRYAFGIPHVDKG